MSPVRLHMGSGKIEHWTEIIRKEGEEDLLGEGEEDLLGEGEEDLLGEGEEDLLGEGEEDLLGEGEENLLERRMRELLIELVNNELQLQIIKILTDPTTQYRIHLNNGNTPVMNIPEYLLQNIPEYLLQNIPKYLLLIFLTIFIEKYEKMLRVAGVQRFNQQGNSLQLRRILLQSELNALLGSSDYANTMALIRYNYSTPFNSTPTKEYRESFKLTAWVQFPLFLLALALKKSMSIENLINFLREGCKDQYDPQVLCKFDPNIFSRFLDPKLNLRDALGLLLEKTLLILEATRENTDCRRKERILFEIKDIEEKFFTIPNINGIEQAITELMNYSLTEIP